MPRAGAMRAVTGRAMDAVLPIDAYLRYGVLPVWLAAGLALRWRDPSRPYPSLLLIAVLPCAVLPYGEACLRDIRWARAARHGRATATDLSGVSEHER